METKNLKDDNSEKDNLKKNSSERNNLKKDNFLEGQSEKGQI